MRGTDFDKLEVNDSGELTDTAALDALIDGDFKPLTTAPRTVSSGGNLTGRTDQTVSTNESMNRLLRGQ